MHHLYFGNVTKVCWRLRIRTMICSTSYLSRLKNGIDIHEQLARQLATPGWGDEYDVGYSEQREEEQRRLDRLPGDTKNHVKERS